jgi:hypothetical protein
MHDEAKGVVVFLICLITTTTQTKTKELQRKDNKAKNNKQRTG